jgi:prepilin-type N-terminal cleavage/methylation domain-containing protein
MNISRMYLHQCIKSNKSQSKGFSLIELMVSLSVFAIVMVVSTSTLLSYIDANAKAQALYSATTNLSFALDSMTREIRTGYHYYCKLDNNPQPGDNLPANDKTGDCPKNNPGNYITFVREKDDTRVGYRLNGTRLEQKMTIGGQTTDWVPLTADDVVIDVFELVFLDTEPYIQNNTDIAQPHGLLTIKGHVNNGLDVDTDFNIQTHIVQRRLDIY